MIHLLNSAIMPAPGRYDLEQITPDQFFQAIVKAYDSSQLVAWIGYPQNRDIIARKTGVQLFLNRANIEIEPGDFMLIMRLKYRVNPQTKGGEVDENDFEYFFAKYQLG
jgi:hypothetical protein